MHDLESVGVCNVQYPVTIPAEHSSTKQSTVADFTMSTHLGRHSRGINMSRLTEQLDHYHKKGWIIDFPHLYTFTKELTERMDQKSAEVTYPWFFERRASQSEKTGLMKAVASKKVTYNSISGFSHEAQLSAGITTLCPCSKEISEYGAHNQRGFITMTVELSDDDI
ncbi:GTP cyclohydrolase, FolE2/MptA family [Alteribacillus sp. HJP-4]|uniref:GTP cyclohydrolase, FolE2/MptA family n=1 Tax=Alteribacillus sp. HJP-4 TaxID=2775394 RepID=UPI0035CD0FC1